MSLDVIVKVPPTPCLDAPQSTTALLSLLYGGRFRLLERTLRDFQQLERHLQLEAATQRSSPLPSVLAAIEAYCKGEPKFYPANQFGVRLAIALEGFTRELATDADLLSTTALKMFFQGNLLTSHETTRSHYRDAVEAAIGADEEEEERVAAGCSVEHQLTVNDEQLVLWKFSSQGSGLVFSADFSTCSSGGEQDVIDPYSVSSYDVVEDKEGETETVQYRTNCDFKMDGNFLYGHFVAEKSGVVTLQWENVDMRSVVSKSLHFQAKVVPVSTAKKVLEVAKLLNDVDAPEWLFDHIGASEITSLGDLPGWDINESEDTFGAVYDDNADESAEKDPQIETAVLEERAHELEAQVMRLEESLAATKTELKSALDRVQIAEEIYKANLETITQLECGPAPKAKRAMDAMAPPAATPGTQMEGPSSELERVQKLCADFQEQCLWRSVENVELETQLAASQVEASSWREKHVEQAAQLVELEKQNRTLRTHKKMLVQEVKRLQPYSQVNLAALVQEAQEARMVQRSLQAKLNSHEQNEAEPADFVLIEQDEVQH